MVRGDRPCSRTKGYSGAHVTLHWMIARLALLRFRLHEGIREARKAVRRGGSNPKRQRPCGRWFPDFSALSRRSIHCSRGVPSPPEAEQPVLKLLAPLTHLVLSAVAFIISISGAVAWFVGTIPATNIQSLGKPPMGVFFVVHVAGAARLRFVLNSMCCARCCVPRASCPSAHPQHCRCLAPCPGMFHIRKFRIKYKDMLRQWSVALSSSALRFVLLIRGSMGCAQVRGVVLAKTVQSNFVWMSVVCPRKDPLRRWGRLA